MGGINPDENVPGGTIGTTGGYGGDLISTAVAAATAIYNSERGHYFAKKQNEANKELAKYQYDLELDMWNRQNQYNSPAEQMARFGQAGLNPSLMYGQGNAGNATTLPKYNAPNMVSEFVPLQGIEGVISSYQDFKMRQAQIDNVNANTNNTNARTATEGLRPGLVSTQSERAAEELEQYKYLKPSQAAIVTNQANTSEAKNQQEWQRLKLMSQQEQSNTLQQLYQKSALQGRQIQNEKLQAEVLFQNYRNQWAKEGVTSSDNPVLRILVRQWNELGLPSFSEGVSYYRNQQRKR